MTSETQRTPQRGVTLVETLVALAVMGFIISSLLVLVGQNTRFASAMAQKNLAAIAADNLMVEALILPKAFELGEEDGATEVAGQSMTYHRVTAQTGVDGVVRLEVSVMDFESGQVLARASTMRPADKPVITQ